MKEIEFPVVSGEGDKIAFPQNPDGDLCPVCYANTLGLDKECAFIHGGALLLDPEDKNRVLRIDNLEAFLFFDWNGADKETVDFEIARDVKKGQYSLNFCSTKCLRSFLNHCVDRLEAKIKDTTNA